MTLRLHLFASLAALLLVGGCATERRVTDARHPDVAIDETGAVTFRGEDIAPEDLPSRLRDCGYTARDTINIHYPDGSRDYRAARRVMAILARNGFTRPILVGDRRPSSHPGGEKPKDRGADAPTVRGRNGVIYRSGGGRAR